MNDQRNLDRACGELFMEIKTASSLLDGAPIGLPHFSTDHADALLLEDEIERRGLQEAYISALTAVLDYPDHAQLSDYWALIRATPEQKARAFLFAMETTSCR